MVPDPRLLGVTGAAPLRVVVTRPAQQGLRWAHTLQGRGFDAVALPLIETVPARNTQALSTLFEHALRGDARLRAIMFVSPQAVQHAAAWWSRRDAAWYERLRQAPTAPGGIVRPRLWVTGSGSATALVDAGCAPDAIDQPPPNSPRFDSEALWAVVRGQVQVGDDIWVVRGATRQSAEDGAGNGRDWLAERLRAAGALVHWCVAYERHLPTWTAAQWMDARQYTARRAVWLFTSSEAVGNLGQLMALAQGSDSDKTRSGLALPDRALATHERVAAAARRLGVADVRVCAPQLDAVVASLESFS